MKKLVLLISAVVIFSVHLSAGPVGPERAMKAAAGIFGVQFETRGSSDLSLVWDGETDSTRGKVDPALYVIERSGGGFVILAADDEVTPVLAISEHNSFGSGNIPSNVAWWLERMKLYVRSESSRTSSARAHWAELETRTRASGPLGSVTGKFEILTPEWDQGNSDYYYFGKNIFNAKCPKYNGQYTITGCTAVALAEVLTALSGIYPDDMPSKGTGTVGGYSVPSGCVAPEQYELDTEYDWAGLRTLTDITAVKNAAPALQENLAQLLADCGAAVEAQYAVNATAAPLYTIPLIKHFYISPNALDAREEDYTSRDWSIMLKEEISKHPIVYSGSSSDLTSGHAFVMDGYGSYKGNDVFRINFGWGGRYNGYYLLTSITPKDDRDYSYYGYAMIGFVPDAHGMIPLEARLMLDDCGSGVYGIAKGNSTQMIQKNVSFNISLVFLNIGPVDFKGSIRGVLVNKNGEIKQSDVFQRTKTLSVRYWTQISISSKITIDPCFGDKIRVEYSTDGSSWEAMDYLQNGTIVGELPVYPDPFISTEKSYSKGDWFIFRLHNHDFQYAGTNWTVISPDGTETVIPQKTGGVLLSKSGKYIIRAAVAPSVGGSVTHNIQTTITVK